MFLFTVTTATANELNLSISTEVNSKSLTLEFKTKTADTDLTLIDESNKVLYFENITDVVIYRKKFDFSELKKGNYKLIVENTLTYTVHSFSLAKDSIEIGDTVEESKPFFKVLDKRMAINFLNLNQDDLTILVYDSEDRIVFSENLNDLVVHKAFNFEKAYADRYTVIMKTKHKSYSENIIIK